MNLIFGKIGYHTWKPLHNMAQSEPIQMTYSNIEGGAPLETARVLLQHWLNLFLQKLVNLHAGQD